MENLETVSAPAATETPNTPTEATSYSADFAMERAMQAVEGEPAPNESDASDTPDAPATETQDAQDSTESEPLTAPPLTDEGQVQEATPAQNFIPKELQDLAKENPAIAPALTRIEQSMAKMHEGFTTFRKMQDAFSTKEGAAQVLSEIQQAYAQAYGETAPAEETEGYGYLGEEDVSKVVAQRVQAELERLGVTNFVKEQQQAKQAQAKEASLKTYIETQAVPMAPEISKRLEGFPVDASMIEKAVRDVPELWQRDPVGAVRYIAGPQFDRFLKGTPATMPPSGGSQVRTFDTSTPQGALDAAMQALDMK